MDENEKARLDVCADEFDPEFALQPANSRRVQLPTPNVAPLDNLLKCRYLLPPDDENYLKPPVRCAASCRSARQYHQVVAATLPDLCRGIQV